MKKIDFANLMNDIDEKFIDEAGKKLELSHEKPRAKAIKFLPAAGIVLAGAACAALVVLKAGNLGHSPNVSGGASLDITASPLSPADGENSSDISEEDKPHATSSSDSYSDGDSYPEKLASTLPEPRRIELSDMFKEYEEMEFYIREAIGNDDYLVTSVEKEKNGLLGGDGIFTPLEDFQWFYGTGDYAVLQDRYYLECYSTYDFGQALVIIDRVTGNLQEFKITDKEITLLTPVKLDENRVLLYGNDDNSTCLWEVGINGGKLSIDEFSIDGDIRFFFTDEGKLYGLEKENNTLYIKEIGDNYEVVGSQEFTEVPENTLIQDFYKRGDYFALSYTVGTKEHKRIMKKTEDGFELIAKDVKYAVSENEIQFAELDGKDCAIYDLDMKTGEIDAVVFETPEDIQELAEFRRLLDGTVIISFYAEDGMREYLSRDSHFFDLLVYG